MKGSRSLFAYTLIALSIINFSLVFIIPAAFIGSWANSASHVQITYRQLVKDGRIIEQPAGPGENADLPVWSLLTPRDRSAGIGFLLMGWSAFQGIVLVTAGAVVLQRRDSRNEAAEDAADN